DVGLELAPEWAAVPAVGWQLETVPGVGSVRLKAVARGGAAEAAGLEVGDELLALDQHRLRRGEDGEAVLARLAKEGRLEEIPVLFCRQGLVRNTRLTPQPPAVSRWRLRPLAEATADALERRRQWLELVP
ncbi:MAG: M61 family peptidase, partial [Cyanobacteriota bacterium]|nr:M61 family peptidase [Cyanobacteriota bacterium]